MNTELIRAARDKKLIPFIGAGFSKNLDLPSWDEVLSIIADKLEWSPEVMLSQGDHYQIAEYYKLVKRRSIAELRSELDKLFNDKSINVLDSEPHSLLVELDAPIIYTTNWDTLIERAFQEHKKPYHVIRNLNDIIDAPRDATHIVKFHGDFTGDDDDIVFTETSYFDRLDFQSALDIKLRSDILGRSVIFIGYSFRDINIRFLWYKLLKLIDIVSGHYIEDYPRSYILSLTPNSLQERLFRSKHIEVIEVQDVNPEQGLVTFLRELVQGVR